MTPRVASPEEQDIIVLVPSVDYHKHKNEVARASSLKITVIKRKLLALKQYELLELPVSACTSITYTRPLAVARMALGAALAALIIGAFFFGKVESGISIAVGLLALGAAGGINLALGVKRHRLSFSVDGRNFTWQSRAGDFKYKTPSVARVVAFARDRGLLAPSSESAP